MQLKNQPRFYVNGIPVNPGTFKELAAYKVRALTPGEERELVKSHGKVNPTRMSESYVDMHSLVSRVYTHND